jgi:hypothetical protein
MSTRIQIVALIGAVVLFVVVLDLVRRRKLLERYALLWLFSALVLIALSAWTNLLQDVASLVGIAVPSNALFAIAFGFVLVLLLHFSVAVSRHADQSKVLAQRVAMLEQRLRRAEGEGKAEPAPAAAALAEAPAANPRDPREDLPPTGTGARR